MSKAVVAARVVLGLIYFIFGLNGFLKLIPIPPMPEPAMNFMGALAATGYMMPFVKLTEIVCGAMLLAGRWVPLALIILAPVVLNIVLLHVFLAPDPGGLLLPILSLILGVYLARAYWSSFAGLMKP